MMISVDGLLFRKKGSELGIFLMKNIKNLCKTY